MTAIIISGKNQEIYKCAALVTKKKDPNPQKQDQAESISF